MNKELRNRINKVNKNWEESETYLQGLNMHLCEHAIFTNNKADAKYIGTIGDDFSIDSIKWN